MKSKTFKKQLQKPYSTPQSYSVQSIIEQRESPKLYKNCKHDIVLG